MGSSKCIKFWGFGGHALGWDAAEASYWVLQSRTHWFSAPFCKKHKAIVHTLLTPVLTQIPGTGLSLNHSTKAFSSSSMWCSSPPFFLNKPGTAAQHHASKFCALPVSLGISTCFFQPFPVGRASDALPELLCNTGIVEK